MNGYGHGSSRVGEAPDFPPGSRRRAVRPTIVFNRPAARTYHPNAAREKQLKSQIAMPERGFPASLPAAFPVFLLEKT
jgi:hypothetical protein